MSFVELGKQLLEAAKNGSLEEVRTLMFNGAPFTTDWLGTSPLHYAAQNGQYEMVDVLLKAGLSRDARTKVDRTPLHYASQEGHSEIVSLLIWYGADVEAKDMLKMTPLHWAVEKGHIDVVQILLAHGASANGMNKFDKTPLDIAVSNRRADIAEMLQLSYNGGSPLEVNPEAVIEEVTTSENDVSCFVSQNINCSDKTETLTWLDASGSTDAAVLDANQMFILTDAGKLALKTLKCENTLGDIV